MKKMAKFSGITMKQGKEFLTENLRDGVLCPCCNRFAKLYRTQINSSMARVLIIIYKAPTDEEGYVHVENYLVSIGSEIKGVHGKLKHWGLVEQKANDDKKKKCSGLWRITEAGRDFVELKRTTHRFAYLFADEAHHLSDEQTTILQALGEEFDYQEIMDG